MGSRLHAAPTSRIKPPKWNVSPGLVAPEWQWAWRGSTFALPMWEGSGLPFDVSQRFQATSMGAAWGVGPEGWQADITTTSQKVAFDDRPGYNLNGDENFAVFLHLERTDTSGTFFMSARDSFGGGLWQIFESGNDLRFGFHDGSTLQQIDAANNDAGGTGLYSFGVIRKVGGHYTLFLDGPSGVNIYTETNATTPDSANHVLTLGDTNQGSAGIPGEYRAAYMWKGTIPTVEQMLRLSADPLGPFRMARRAIGPPSLAPAPEPSWVTINKPIDISE